MSRLPADRSGSADPAAGFDRRWRILDAIERLAQRYWFVRIVDAVLAERRKMVHSLDSSGKKNDG